MKAYALAALCLGLPGLLGAYGVSPSQSDPGLNQAPPANPGNSFQLQPAPMPSNNLAPGSAPPMPNPQMQQSAQQDIHKNIAQYQPADWAKAWGHIHLEEAKELAKDPSVLFADARSKIEYDQGHIPGAIPLPLGEFDKYFKMYESKIKKARKIVTYCHGAGCQLSDKCAQKLYVDHKFHNVASFFGGEPQWREAGLPMETGPEPKKK